LKIYFISEKIKITFQEQLDGMVFAGEVFLWITENNPV